LTLSRQPRLALILGNSDYNRDGDTVDGRSSDSVRLQNFAPDLPNATNDASDVATAFRAVGFTSVNLVLNADRSQMTSTDFAFEQKIKAAGPDAIVVRSYAGHAIQVSGVNFIVPSGATLPNLDFTRLTDAEAEYRLVANAIALNGLYDRLKSPSSVGLNWLMLDACRRNPWETRSVGRSVDGQSRVARGLAHVRLGLRRTAVACATKPGDIAEDGYGRNSPYTAALKAWLARPGVNVRDLFDRVGAQVERDTNGRTPPWFLSSTLGGVCLGPRESA